PDTIASGRRPGEPYYRTKAPPGAEADAGYTRGVIESRALTGDDLTVADVWAVAVGRAPVALSDAGRERMLAAREVVEQAVHGRQEHTYGVNTGFGRFVSRSIPEELAEELQLRLLRSHACGVGEPYP